MPKNKKNNDLEQETGENSNDNATLNLITLIQQQMKEHQDQMKENQQFQRQMMELITNFNNGHSS